MAIKNIGAFKSWINEQVNVTIPEQLEKFQKVIVLELFRRIVLKSPVGNPDLWQNPAGAPPGYVGGRFRANWQITIGTPAEGVIESTAAPVANVPNLPKFSTVYITNNVPYAERLEMGWSSQAPSGIVSVSIAEIIAFVE